MEVIDTDLAEVKVFKPKRFEDARGYFCETYSKNRFDDRLSGPEGPLAFVQDNESLSVEPYTVRGLHFQAPPAAQDKLVRVSAGRILDVVVDIRRGSPTYGAHICQEISAENGLQILAPKGFLHGFMSLEPNTLVCYKMTAHYDASCDGAVFWASPELNIPWPADAARAVVSDKDQNAVRFSEFLSPFDY